MYYHSFLGHLWDISMSHKLRDIYGTLLGQIEEPQINADERRYVYSAGFGKRIHRKGRKERKAAEQEPLRFCVNKIRYGINNELERTETNSGYSELVRVRISSLLISILRHLYAPAHERAPPAPAVHSWLSRAGG